MKINEIINEDKDPCWDNYKQIGMKTKNGKQVPNCVPKEGVPEGEMSPMAKDERHADRIRSLKNLISIAKEQGRQLRVQELELELNKLQGVAEGYTGRETKDGTWRVFKNGQSVSVAGPFKSAKEAQDWIKKQSVTEGFAIGKVVTFPELIQEISKVLSSHTTWKMSKRDDSTFLFNAANDYGVRSMLVVQTAGDNWVTAGHGIVGPDGNVQIFKQDSQHLPLTLATAHEIGDKALEIYSDVDLTDYADNDELAEDWQKVNKKDKTDGMSKKAVKAYRRENPGSKLQTAVTKKPSELKAGSKDAKRRKSFCARMNGVDGPMKDEKGNPTPKAKALKRWNC